MKRVPALAALTGTILLIGVLTLPSASRAIADVTGEPIDPSQEVPQDPSDTQTPCSAPCTGNKTCLGGNAACCCRPVGGGAAICSCKSPEDCKNSSTQLCG